MTLSGPPPTAEGGGRRAAGICYRLFGLTLETDFDFRSPLPRAEGPAEVRFSLAGAAPVTSRLGEPVFTSPFKDEAGRSVAYLYRLPGTELLRFDNALDFYLAEREIRCHLRDPDCLHLVELRLLGPVMAYWLERRSICALHASAVVVGGRAIAFMAANRGGKSGLAAALMTAGRPLLSDDLLPVELGEPGFTAHPGYPQMRMWPDAAAHFVGELSGLEKVHPRLDKLRVPVGGPGLGSFHAAAAPLAGLYLPERRPAVEGSPEIEIVPLSARSAVIELVRSSFSPFLVEAAGLQPERLELLARLADRLPVRRLRYPPGLDRLQAVGRAVLADCRGLPAGG